MTNLLWLIHVASLGGDCSNKGASYNLANVTLISVALYQIRTIQSHVLHCYNRSKADKTVKRWTDSLDCCVATGKHDHVLETGWAEVRITYEFIDLQSSLVCAVVVV